ncbi:glutamine--fructose-6-phosphate transaminase (isomerizing) [Acidaminococcus sp. CAG:542]|uniref:glutamine--fructose-6-phosphate transaminase (isomerizing) n=1 Tax=Acidaminococcus sp. CAG:542 TaxID=1262687 RepID=UPI00033C5F94|nr:glutamine--fructose-6-phosphate transaminase (isomerizing) [Acidaminococcus sp. CAG:542]CDE93773.1 glucosamine--fructose-6-phosphate aminotransferase [isomerizing] [Acidaminococcus sp. CAG:542]
MCGIVGYIGRHQATPFLMEGLSKLEYRGYDSAGIAVYNDGKIDVEKCVGRLDALRQKIVGHEPVGTLGIGHTRWATHGKPSDINAHPHADESGQFAVVHNGIIENYMPLKQALLKKGHHFRSDTDTEVVPHLMADLWDGDFESTVRKVLHTIKGSYSLVFLCAKDPSKLICAKKNNPLVIGLGKGENYIASDIPAIISKTRDTYILSDGEMAVVEPDKVVVKDLEGHKIDKKVFRVNWDAEAAEKGGFEHFMLKEIYEQPKAVRDTLRGRVDKGSDKVVFNELNWTPETLKDIRKIFIVACGTAYHAGIVGKYYIEKMARIPVEVDIASEFRYRNPIIDESCLCIVISQSGETSDTLEALKEAKRRGAKTMAVTNVVGSSIAREADQVVYTYAGPEIAVASTKAYTTQLIVMLLLSLYISNLKGKISDERLHELIQSVLEVPEQMHDILDHVDQIKVYATNYANREDAFFLGRSLDYAVALEGALKLKEISYIHAEAYAAGELKHGTLALITEGVPVIVLATQSNIYDKTISNLQEVKTRGAIVIGIGMEGDTELAKHANNVIIIPKADEDLAPILAVIPLQLLAYYAALARGCDVDKPRNLAKSVTVE